MAVFGGDFDALEAIWMGKFCEKSREKGQGSNVEPKMKELRNCFIVWIEKAFEDQGLYIYYNVFPITALHRLWF